MSVLVLASSSPRRRALLTLAGIEHRIVDHAVDEQALSVTSADGGELALVLAAAKADEVARRSEGDPVLAADTTVEVAGRLLGTPRDRAEASAMVRAASGQHLLIRTGVALRDRHRHLSGLVTTEVIIRPIDEDEIREYVASGAGDDKAAALELQGRAAGFVSEMRGCPGSVFGLPVCEVAELIDHQAPCTDTCLATELGRSPNSGEPPR